MRLPVPGAALALTVLGVAGCGGGDPAPTTRSDTATAAPKTTAPEAPAPKAPAGRTVAFRASDGVRLQGTLIPAPRRRAPAVVLVHEYHGGPDQWSGFVGFLHRAGYATLAYGSRSSDSLDETVLVRDLAGAVAALRRRPEVDPQRIAVVGASIGASTAAWAIGTRPALRLRAAVGLSPAESPSFISAGTAGRFRPHDLLLIADGAELSNAQSIAQDAGHGTTVRRAAVTGHGVALLPDARVRAAVLEWLRPRLRVR
jgi:predicted esterase